MITNYLNRKLEEEYHHLNLWYFVSFIFGIILFFQFLPDKSLYVFVSCGALITLLIGFFRRRSIIIYFFLLCFLSLIVGMLIANIRLNSVKITPLTRTMVATLEGEVESLKPTLRGVQLLLQKSKSNANRDFNKVRLNISDKLSSDLAPGDIIRLKAKLFPLQSSVLPGSYDFGFYMYMSGIEATGYALTSPEVISSNSSAFSKYIKLKRRQIYKRLVDVLGSANGNFAAAILIGETKAIPKDISENMRNSGVAHILSVSGLHLSLVAMIFFVSSRALLNISNFLAYNTNIKVISAAVSIIGSFLYLQISGNNIAATRAFIMTCIFISAMIFGRSPYPLRSVTIAAFLILCFLPEYIFHPSFQLSFTAVLCLISGYEFYLKNKKLLGNSKGVFASIKFYLFANIYSSFLASIVTAPFVIYHFYKFANYSVLMNLLAVPLMSFFMMPLALLSIFLMPFGIDLWVLKSLGFFISIVTDFAEFIVSQPFSIWYFGHISPLSLAIFSFGFFWICLWQTSWRIIGIAIMALGLGIMLNYKNPDFIYDHDIKAVGINEKDGLKIYADVNLPKFISDYWANWFGYKQAKIIESQINKKDRLYILGNGKSVALNYWNCQEADIGIITSKKLRCSNSNIISNSYLWKNKKILVRCNIDDKCIAR